MQAPTPPTEPNPPVQSPPPRKANKTILLLSGIVLLVLVVSSILAVTLLPRGASPAGPTTPTVLAGFQRFSNSYFSIIYPQGWTAQAITAPIGEDFSSSSAQGLEVTLNLNADATDASLYPALLCSGIQYTHTSPPDSVKIAGVFWSRRTCDASIMHTVVEAGFHNGVLFVITYYSKQDDFSANAARYYQPMEQSFTFLN
jgi:hypothetical protein